MHINWIRQTTESEFVLFMLPGAHESDQLLYLKSVSCAFPLEMCLSSFIMRTSYERTKYIFILFTCLHKQHHIRCVCMVQPVAYEWLLSLCEKSGCISLLDDRWQMSIHNTSSNFCSPHTSDTFLSHPASPKKIKVSKAYTFRNCSHWWLHQSFHIAEKELPVLIVNRSFINESKN